VRQKNSDKRLDELVREDAEQAEQQGILEIFPRDEDAPLTRAGDADEPEAPTRRHR
jgi:hypothetical protein